MSRYNAQTDSYGGWTNYQRKNIILPEKLRCKRCNKWKAAEGKENFSKKQLDEARTTIYYSRHGKQTPLTVVCVNCNSGQVTELRCVECDSTKGLECFAKAQRRNPVAAKCLVCMDEQLRFDADHEAEKINATLAAHDDDYDSDSDSSDGHVYSFAEDDDAASDVANLSIADDTTETGYETGSAVTSSYFNSKTGSRAISSMNTTGHASSGGVQLSQAESGLSRWQQVSGTRARKGVSSNTGVNGSISSASTPVPRTQINYNNDSGRKFAKIKAYKPPPASFAATVQQAQKSQPQSKPAEEIAAVQDPAWESDEESEVADSEGSGELEAAGEHEIVWESDSDSDSE